MSGTGRIQAQGSEKLPKKTGYERLYQDRFGVRPPRCQSVVV
jgi:hypothetical protein